MSKVVNVKETKKYDVYIGRPSIYGNPFIIGKDGDRKTVIAKYKKWIYKTEQSKLRKNMKKNLKNKILGCYCKPFACHGDVMLEIINEE